MLLSRLCTTWCCKRSDLSTKADGGNLQSEDTKILSALFSQQLSTPATHSIIYDLIHKLCNSESSAERLQVMEEFMDDNKNMIMVVIYNLVANVITIKMSTDNATVTNNQEKINNILQALGGMGIVLIISIILKVIKNHQNYLTCDTILKNSLKELAAYFAVAISMIPAHYPPEPNNNNSNYGEAFNGFTKSESLIFSNTVLQLVASWYKGDSKPSIKHIASNLVSGGVLSLLGVPIEYLWLYLGSYCTTNKYSVIDTTAIIAAAILLCDILFACLNTMRLSMLDDIFSHKTSAPASTTNRYLDFV